MKFYNLCLVLFLFFMSCSNTEELSNAVESSASLPRSNFDTYKIDGDYPSNPHNPYDIVGTLHVELYKTYYTMDSIVPVSLTVAERVLWVAQQNDTFTGLSTQPYLVTQEYINYLSEQIACCSSNVIGDSLLSSEGTTSLQTLMTTILSYCDEEEDYTAIYDLIISYENTVIESNMPIADKQILLSTAAVVRYVTYERKKKPKKNTDPDWDLMVWRIAGTAVGSADGIKNAIVYSVICGILENGE